MTQQQKILLALYYGGPTTAEKLRKIVGFFDKNTMTKLKKMGFVWLFGRNKHNEWMLNITGFCKARTDSKKLSRLQKKILKIKIWRVS